MKNSDQQQAITSALGSLAAAEWHMYSIPALSEYHRQVVEQIYSLCSPVERLFLDVFGRLLSSGAVPCYPLMSKEFPANAKTWLRKLYELEPTPANAPFYAQRAVGKGSTTTDVDYRIRREDGKDSE